MEAFGFCLLFPVPWHVCGANECLRAPPLPGRFLRLLETVAAALVSLCDVCLELLT